MTREIAGIGIAGIFPLFSFIFIIVGALFFEISSKYFLEWKLKYELCRANIIQICGGKFVEILVWIRARSIVISNNDRESHWCDKWGFKFTKVCVSLTQGTRMKLWKITSRSRREPEWKDFNISRVRPSTLERSELDC